MSIVLRTSDPIVIGPDSVPVVVWQPPKVAVLEDVTLEPWPETVDIQYVCVGNMLVGRWSRAPTVVMVNQHVTVAIRGYMRFSPETVAVVFRGRWAE